MAASVFPYGSVAGEAEHKETIYLQRTATDLNAIVPSSSTFAKNTFSFVDSSKTTRTVNINDTEVPILTSASDSIGLDNEGDSTEVTTPNFDEIYGIRPRRAFVPQQIFLNLMAGMNISAYTSGNFVLHNVILDMYQFSAGSLYPLVQNIRYPSGLGNLATTGSQLFIIRDSIPCPGVVLSPNDVLAVRVQVNITGGVGTHQTGICPVFPLNALATLKDWSVSSVIVKGVGVAS